MWADAQRDGRSAKYRWRPLFNAAVWLTPTTRVPCSNAAKTRTRWNLQGCPKQPNRSQLLVGRSLRYCEDVGEILLSSKFFPIVDTCLSCEDIARQSCATVPRWQIFDDFLGPAFPASRVHHISDLHLKFALRQHHVWKYGRHPVCDGWD